MIYYIKYMYDFTCSFPRNISTCAYRKNCTLVCQSAQLVFQPGTPQIHRTEEQNGFRNNKSTITACHTFIEN
jgi:hypothetical protein